MAKNSPSMKAWVNFPTTPGTYVKLNAEWMSSPVKASAGVS